MVCEEVQNDEETYLSPSFEVSSQERLVIAADVPR